MSSESKRLADFGPFTFNLSERTLQRSNVPVDLHRRAAEILGYLIEHRGQWISKDELKNQIWRKQFVEASAINRQIFEIRRALDDSPQNPRFIKTKYQYGWRFIASVTERTEEVTGPRNERSLEKPLPNGRGSEKILPEDVQGAQQQPLPTVLTIRGTARISTRAAVLLATAFVSIVAALTFWLLPKPQPRILNSAQLTDDGKLKSGPLLTDGQRIFFMEEIAGANRVFSVPVSGGEPDPLNVPLSNATLQSILRDGSTLLLQSNEPNGSKLWAYSITHRSLQLVQSRSSQGAWTSDGRFLAAASADQSSIKISGQRFEKKIDLPGYVQDLNWSPDEKRLRFTLLDRKRESSAEWGIPLATLVPRRLFANPKSESFVVGGAWTQDGKYFLYGAGRYRHSDIWVSRESGGWLPFEPQGPWRLTNGGPGSWQWPLPSRDKSTIFALNSSVRSELVRFDKNTKSWRPLWGGAPAYELDYSKDLKWVAYTYLRDHTIWKARPDGSEQTRLTKPGIEAHQPHWSPDGSRIAFMGMNAKEQWRVFEISSKGGTPEALLPDGDDQGTPTWSPDGKSLIFGDRIGRKPTSEMSIHMLDLSTRTLTGLAGSQGLWSPRWSTDGRYIAAITSDSKAICIAPAKGGGWRQLAKMNFVDNATWSPDSRYIYFNGNDEINHRRLLRLSIPDGRLERIADLADFMNGIENWYGVDPGGVPLAFHGVAVQEIYAMQCVLP